MATITQEEYNKVQNAVNQAYTADSLAKYSSAYKDYMAQWMSSKDAYNKASSLLVKNQTPTTTTTTTKTNTATTTPTTSTKNTAMAVPEYQWKWTQTNTNYQNQWDGNYVYNQTSSYYEKTGEGWTTTQSSTASNIDKIRDTWNSYTYEQQQEKLKNNPSLQASLTKYWITNKKPWETTTPANNQTSSTPKSWDGWDYQDNSQARMDEIQDNLNKYRVSDPYLFDDYDTFYNFFLKGKNRTPEQEQVINDYFNKMKKYNQYDNMSSDDIWAGLVNGKIPEDYISYLKYSDPQRYAEIQEARKKAEDKIKSDTSMDTINTITGDSEDTITSKAIEWLKSNWLFVDKDGNLIDDRTENYATDEEKQYAKDASDIIARNLEIDNIVKHTYDDLVKAYPWATKATLMAMAQDRNADLLREKENNNVELTRLQWYMDYMQSERQERTRVWENAINQLQKQYGMYYEYSPEWMSELAQAQYAATNITLDQADSWTETQKQMALQNVLDWYYEKYWDIIQRSEAQVINDVIALANEKGISLSQALEENFLSPLRSKPEFKQMQAMLSEPNLQTIWYNSDGKAVYWYWDSTTKTFQPVTIWADGITTWWTTWVWASYTTNTEPLNNFITNLEANYTIASNWWTWGSKIRGWWCGTVVNDYLWSIWDSLKLKEANDIKSYATSKTPEEWAVAYFDWTQSRATPETKKHGHVWIVVSDNGDTITVLESNEWTWLRYNDYKKSWVTGYYIPDWIKSTEYNTQEYNKAFTDAANVIKQYIDWLWNKEIFMDDVEDYLTSWDYTTLINEMMAVWKGNADSTVRDKINASETAIVDLISIKDALEAYYAAWWDTWILQWNLEKVANALWNTTDPRLVWLATKISEAIQAYRKNISWTAFNEKEAKEYEELFPSIKAWEEYNTAKIQEVLDSMIIRASWQYSNLFWPWIYMKLLDAHEKATWRKYSVYEEQSDLYRYLADNWYLTPSWAVKTADDFASWYQTQQTRIKGKRF